VQGKMKKVQKKGVLTTPFVSQNQLFLEGFETLFDKKLNPENRWVILAKLIPWDFQLQSQKPKAKSLLPSPNFSPNK
jgi:hypothetical protein